MAEASRDLRFLEETKVNRKKTSLPAIASFVSMGSNMASREIGMISLVLSNPGPELGASERTATTKHRARGRRDRNLDLAALRQGGGNKK